MKELQDKLIQELENLIAFLNIYEEYNWSLTFVKVKKVIKGDPKYGLQILNDVNGGMGSFTDLVICQMNGHNVNKDQENLVNEELRRLSDIVFSTAYKFSRALSKNNEIKNKR